MRGKYAVNSQKNKSDGLGVREMQIKGKAWYPACQTGREVLRREEEAAIAAEIRGPVLDTYRWRNVNSHSLLGKIIKNMRPLPALGHLL